MVNFIAGTLYGQAVPFLSTIQNNVFHNKINLIAFRLDLLRQFFQKYCYNSLWNCQRLCSLVAPATILALESIVLRKKIIIYKTNPIKSCLDYICRILVYFRLKWTWTDCLGQKLIATPPMLNPSYSIRDSLAFPKHSRINWNLSLFNGPGLSD